MTLPLPHFHTTAAKSDYSKSLGWAIAVNIYVLIGKQFVLGIKEALWKEDEGVDTDGL